MGSLRFAHPALDFHSAGSEYALSLKALSVFARSHT